MNDIDNYERYDFLRSGLNGSKPIGESESLSLISIMRDSSKDRSIRILARNRLIQSNLRMIYSVADIMSKKTGKSIPDIFQAGVVGMIRAACDYDPDKMINGKRCKFMSYAIWWISHSMHEEIYRSNDTVHVPMYGKYLMAKKLKENNLDIDAPRTVDFLRATAPIVSLDAPARSNKTSIDDGSLTVGDMIEDSESTSAFEKIVNENEDKKLGELMKMCTSEQDIQLLRDLFFRGMNMNETGIKHNLTSERIRQKRNRIIRHVSTALKRLMQDKKFTYNNTNNECTIDAIFNPDKYK